MTQKQTTIIEPDMTALIGPVAEANEIAAFKVATVADHRNGLAHMKDLAALRAQVVAAFKEPKAAAYTAHKSITSLERRFLNPIDKARGIIEPALLKFEAAQELKAKQEKAALEQKAQEDAQKARRFEADVALADGSEDEAQAILEAPVTPVVIDHPAEVARMEGTATVWRYGFEVEDFHTLVKAVAKDRSLLNLLQTHSPSIRAMVTALKDNCKIPGIKVVKTASKRVQK